MADLTSARTQVVVDSAAGGESGVMAQPDRQEREPAVDDATIESPRPHDGPLGAAKHRFARSTAQRFLVQLQALDFANQATLFGAGLLVALLPLLILLSAFAHQGVDDDLALRMGLNQQAARIVSHLFTRTSSASPTAATVVSLVFLTIATLAVAASLQQIYEKAFHQDPHRGRGVQRQLIWIVALCGMFVVQSLAGRAVQEMWFGILEDLLTFVLMTLFFWWTMHFLLVGRVRWGRLLPSAVATGICFAGLGVFSKLYFSSTIVSDSKTYGSIGAVFCIMTWLIAVGAVIILGAVTGALWEDRRSRRTARPAE